MTIETPLQAAKRIIAGRVFGPFREEGGKPGETSYWRLETAASAYLWNRRVRNLPAARALELAAPWALRPHTERPGLWYGPRGGVGARFNDGADVLRWFESTADVGIRFVGWADELASLHHSGWYSDDEQTGLLCGGVWQLPARNGRARLIYGYTEREGRKELNPGSARLVVSHILESEPCRDWESVTDLPEVREAARYADGMAESAAEKEREYRAAYEKGREAAEADAEALEARKTARPLIRELKAALRVPMARAAFPKACQALRERIDSLVETISEARETRDSLWCDCGSFDAEAFRAGFIDHAEGGFVRAVRLGYAKATDWGGPAESNPCNAGVVA